MAAIDVIERALAADILLPSLTYVPQRGAVKEQLTSISGVLPRPLSESHERLLKRWDGLNLDVLRLYGASPHPGELRGLAEAQIGPLVAVPGTVVFGDDPAGFVYGETKSGEVMSFDSASGQMKKVAESIDDFFERLVFGKDAADFAGADWLYELKSAGLV